MIELEWFDIEEFACPCCGRHDMNHAFLRRLDRARESAAVPFVITKGGGFRCEDYNDSIGGVEGSAHTAGLAADLAATDSHTRFQIMRALFEHGMLRLGLNFDRLFIHVDGDDSKPERVLWGY